MNFTCTSTRPYGVPLLKTMKETNAPMHIIFKTTGETQRSIVMNQRDAIIGTFLIKLSPFRNQGANLECNVKSVMGGWNSVTIL